MKKVTVPAAGKTKRVKLTGLSVKIFASPNYKSLDVCPKLGFNQRGLDWPIEAGDAVPFGNCTFENLTITGTPESAGDTIYLQSLDHCVDVFKQPDRAAVTKSIAGTTTPKVASDQVQSFSKIELKNEDKNFPKRLYIWVANGATRGINFAYNADPSQGYPATDAMYWDNDQSHNQADERSSLQPLEIIGLNWILSFRFIASVATETPSLIWTAEY